MPRVSPRVSQYLSSSTAFVPQYSARESRRMPYSQCVSDPAFPTHEEARRRWCRKAAERIAPLTGPAEANTIDMFLATELITPPPPRSLTHTLANAHKQTSTPVLPVKKT